MGRARPVPPTAYAILGLLSMTDELSGYDLRRWARALRFFYVSPAQSQIYSELRRLAALGWVAQRDVAQEARPAKRLYRTTEDGQAALRGWLEGSPVEPPALKHALLLRIFFGHLARPERLQALIDDYITAARMVLAELEQVRAELGDDPRWRFPAAVAEWGLRYYAAETEAAAAIRPCVAEAASRA